MPSSIAQLLAKEVGFSVAQVEKVVALLDEGNTIPFLARYRKEATGGLDEVGLRAVQEGLGRLRKLEDRRAEITRSLTELGVLSAELAAAVAAADKLATLEDLYLPFRPKRRTRAQVARERGLGPLADLLRRPRPGAAPGLAGRGARGGEGAQGR